MIVCFFSYLNSGLTSLFNNVFSFSAERCMLVNMPKTFYLNLQKNPCHEPIILHNNECILPAENDEHYYLGLKFIASNDLKCHIKKNLDAKENTIIKYFDWLNINTDTPITIKLQVLYSCVIPSYLYAVETWWMISYF